jgi:hypothetical protein
MNVKLFVVGIVLILLTALLPAFQPGGPPTEFWNHLTAIACAIAAGGVILIALSMRLRFTIRDLLWLVVVVALAVGWLLDHDTVRRESDRLRAMQVETQQKADDLDVLRASVKALYDRQGLK